MFPTTSTPQSTRLHEVIQRITDPISGLLGAEPMYVREVARRAKEMKEYHSPVLGKRYFSWKKNDPRDVFIKDAPIGWAECVAALKTLTKKTRTLTHAPTSLVDLLEDEYGRKFMVGSIVPTAMYIVNPLPSFPQTGGIIYIPNHIYFLTGRYEDDKRYRRALQRKIDDVARASSAGFRNARNWEDIAFAVCQRAFPTSTVVPSSFNSPKPDILIKEKMLSIEITTRNTNPLDEDYLTTKLMNSPHFFDIFILTPVKLSDNAKRFFPRVRIGRYRIEGGIHVRHFPNRETVEAQKRDVGVIGGVMEYGQLDGFAVITPKSRRDVNIMRRLHRKARQYTRADMEKWMLRAIKDMFYRISMNIYVIYRRLYYLKERRKPRSVLYRHAEAFLRNTLDMTPERAEAQIFRLRDMGWVDFKDKRYAIRFIRTL